MIVPGSSIAGALQGSLRSFAENSASAAVRDAYIEVLSKEQLTLDTLHGLAKQIAQLKSKGLATDSDTARIALLIQRVSR